MQSPGAPVRPGWVGDQGGLFWVWGGQPRTLSLVPFCSGQVGLALPLFVLTTDLSALAQVCAGVPQDAALRESKATLPEA